MRNSISNNIISTPNDSIVYSEQTGKCLSIRADTTYFYSEKNSTDLDIIFNSEIKFASDYNYKPVKPKEYNHVSILTLGLILPGFILAAITKTVFRIPLLMPFIRIFNKKIEPEKEKTRFSYTNLFFSIFFFMGVFLTTFQIVKINEINLLNINNFVDSLAITLIFAIAYTLLLIINKILTLIFNLEIFNKYNSILTEALIGIGFPLFILASASLLSLPGMQIFFLILTLTLFLTVYIKRFMKYTRINSLFNLRFYYLFLYLCILEIIPVLVICRLISQI